MKHILCGNPNVGKTTFLNSLTGANEHVGNWHGVTVDFLEKKYVLGGEENTIVDLPGFYSLCAYSFEEQIAIDYVYSSDDYIINLVDANNLSRNLYLTLNLLELGKNIKVCLNFANELKKTNTEIDTKKLAKMLGTGAVLFDAQNKKQTQNLLDKNFKNNFDCPYFKELPLKQVSQIIGENFKNLSKFNKDFVCVKVLEQDPFILEKLNLNKTQTKQLKQFDLKDRIVELRFEFIDQIIKACQTKKSDKIYGYSKLDKIVLNRFFALPIFAVIMFLIFYLTFSLIGPIISDALSIFIEKFINAPILTLLSKVTSSKFILSFFENGVLTVLSTIASFLPQIVLLFLSLSILEDTGYISRLAFTFEDIFSKVGLNGKSVFTLLMGFGCSTTASLTSRTMEDKNSKIKATILCGYTSCTAKIPLYSVILGAFFKNNILIIFFLYLLGVLVALIVSMVLERTLLKSKESNFIMEMPAYRFPNFKRIVKLICFNVLDFLKRVTGVLFAFSIIIWLLQNVNIHLKFIENPSEDVSILSLIGNFLAPIFAPLGFAEGGCVSALICGIVAKEVIVSTMAIINSVDINLGVQNLSQSFLNESNPIHFTPISAFSYLIFSLLYLPCIATISVYFKELGKKWTVLALAIQFAVAYLVTFVFYRMLTIFRGLNFVSILLSLSIFALIAVAFFFLLKLIKKPKVCCLFCSKCEKNIGCGKSKIC
ncbi:MAG: ferrous iron transport protein B [Christensenellales bacterium]